MQQNLHKITLVTSNPGKLAEWKNLLALSAVKNFKLQMSQLDLDEIQSLDPEAIIEDKAKRAYAVLKTPVIVEDVSAGLDKLSGLPGPFIKYFEQKLGPTALLQLAEQPGDPVTITCTLGYYDGTKMIFTRGVVKATVVEPRGTNGFGFDAVVMPNGQPKTYGEMTTDEKNKLSHRSLAIRAMITKLNRLHG